MKTVIMAGGKGTRVASIATNTPKPMLPIAGKPVLEWELEVLREQGFTDLILSVGHLGQTIMDYFGDGARFGVHIEYFFEREPLGSAGALFALRDCLTEDFLLLNGDIVFNVDLDRFVRRHRDAGGLATLFTHPNSHPYDSSLIVADRRGAVVRWLSAGEDRVGYYRNRVNAGLHLLSPKLLTRRPESATVDLDRQLLKPLAGSGALFVYDSPEYVRDMGTPQRYQAVCADLQAGIVQRRNLHRPQRAIFLDRDGTINRHVGFLRNIDDFVLLPGVADGIRKINQAGYLAIVVTNQPVIARGEASTEEVEDIHNKMETLLGREGAYLDAIYYCPHHPDGGYPGERPEYKISCDCRKPQPGLLLRAAEAFHIDLENSWMVGDGENDIRAGKAAGCRTALIGKEQYGQDVTVPSLLAFTDRI